MKRAIIIESHVVEGHVGNRAATPCLQLLNYEVLVVPTVLYTCRVGWPGFAGEEIPASHLGALLDYITTRPADITVTGYLGSTAGVNEVISRAAGYPGTLITDPVMGDYPGGLYVSEEVAAKIARELVPLAEAITPNKFEAEIISDQRITDLASAFGAAERIQRMGPKTVVITSCHRGGTARACNILAAPGIRAVLYAPYINSDRTIYGAGDMLTAIFAGLLGNGVDSTTAALVSTAIVGRAVDNAWKNNLDTVNPLGVLLDILPLLQGGDYQAIAALSSASLDLL